MTAIRPLTATADDLFLLYPAVTKQRWRCILDKTASALEFLCDQFQNIPVIFHQIILMNSNFFY